MSQEQEVEIDLSEFQEEEREAGIETEEAPEFSEIEQKAMEHGWNPDGVEGKRNLTAEEFMDRQPIYDDLRSTKKQIKQLRESMDALKQHNATIAKRERERLIQELKAAKLRALEDGRHNEVIDIDDQIADARATPIDETPKTNVAFETFVEENPWYNQDDEMKQFADEVGTGHFQNHPNKSLDEVYAYVTKRVKAQFPEKFQSKRTRAAAVEGATAGRAGRSKQKYSVKDLPEEHRDIMKTLVRSKTMTEEEYLKQYFGE